jgi:hypothetical protein
MLHTNGQSVRRGVIIALIALLPVALAQSAISFEALAQPSYNGTWSGTTTQGRPFFLVVADGALTRIETSFVLPGCTANTITTSTIPIVGNTFSLFGINLSFDGTFNTETSASGTARYSDFVPGCPGTVDVGWTATRDGGVPPTATATSTATATTSATATNTATATTSATATSTATATTSATATNTATATTSATATPTATVTTTATATTTTVATPSGCKTCLLPLVAKPVSPTATPPTAGR